MLALENENMQNKYVKKLPKIHIEILSENFAALIDHSLIKESHIRHIIKYIKDSKKSNADNIQLLRNVCVTKVGQSDWLENIPRN